MNFSFFKPIKTDVKNRKIITFKNDRMPLTLHFKTVRLDGWEKPAQWSDLFVQ